MSAGTCSELVSLMIFIAGFCEHDSENSGSIKGGELREQLSLYRTSEEGLCTTSQVMVSSVFQDECWDSEEDNQSVLYCHTLVSNQYLCSGHLPDHLLKLIWVFYSAYKPQAGRADS